MKRRAVALLSGGLDSLLAVKIIMAQGIEVRALTCMTHFGCDGHSSCGHDPREFADDLGFHVKLYHLGEEYVEMVKKPRFGYGKHMNPCLDCRLMMLAAAREYMEAIDASFIITGEVVGQRPMSQRRDALAMIDRESGLKGLILRPLSAKLLPPTIPEMEGIVDREKLYAIKGRSRKVQMELAKQFGITKYPSPAGGCLLTDSRYSEKLRDLFHYVPDARVEEIHLLTTGRHFRISEQCKIIVGRDQAENEVLSRYTGICTASCAVTDYPSPLTLVFGPTTPEERKRIAEITARYSKAPWMAEARVRFVYSTGESEELIVKAAVDAQTLDALRI
ncbi:MAG: DUF814 domain-containing protein [Nitrospinota bacterium]|nr:MAG: DUF814 domain-containing protein [Nitrospinota bacterium]